MKMKALVLATTLIASNAFADAPGPAKKCCDKLQNYYGKIEAGITMPKIKNNFVKSRNALTTGIGGGYKFDKFLRSDLMLHYKNTPTTHSIMLNGYLDAKNETIATPYLMAGLGAGHTTVKAKISNGNGKLKKVNFLWNAGLGCHFEVHDKVNLDLGYRYVQNFGKLGSKNIAGTSVKLKRVHAHEIIAGAVYYL
jgi:opacity protein-like surface antigen